MRQLLNTLYVTSEDAYLSLKNDNVIVQQGDAALGQIPLRSLESIVSFSYKGASPALMGRCSEFGVGLSFFSPHGRYYCSILGENNRNVLLRREQFRFADDDGAALLFARSFIIFFVFDDLILRNKDAFFFEQRSRRPPLDRANALMSFVYSILTSDCIAALQGVGLDPYVGFLHTDRPGRASLALDLVEEFRPALADRFVLTLINTGAVKPSQFEVRENGGVFLSESGRKTVQNGTDHSDPRIY